MLAICLAMLEDDEDKRRFEQIYDKYNKLISRTALKILGDEEQAFDVTSNVFLAIARNIRSFPDSDEPARERSYLYMSVRNYCVNEKIKRANKPLILDIDTVVYNGAENGALDLLVQVFISYTVCPNYRKSRRHGCMSHTFTNNTFPIQKGAIFV